MFLEPTHQDGFAFASDAEIEASPDIRSILKNSDLPAAVRIAPLTSVIERTIDASEVARLTTGGPAASSDDAWIERIRKRREALSRHLGRTLICVLIRLPGVAYTIEIDPVTSTIIHWEWQAS